MKKGEIYSDDNYFGGYIKVIEIYKKEDNWGNKYTDKLKELGIKTTATIICYHKATNKDFNMSGVYISNCMKLSDFKNNFTKLTK